MEKINDSSNEAGLSSGDKSEPLLGDHEDKDKEDIIEESKYPCKI